MQYIEEERFEKLVYENMKFSNADMLNCSFSDCIIIGLDWSELQEDKLLPFTELKKCTLRYNFFIQFSLMNKKYDGCTFEGCSFEQ